MEKRHTAKFTGYRLLQWLASMEHGYGHKISDDDFNMPYPKDLKNFKNYSLEIVIENNEPVLLIHFEYKDNVEELDNQKIKKETEAIRDRIRAADKLRKIGYYI